MIQELERGVVLFAMVLACLGGQAWATDKPLDGSPPPRKVYISFHIIRISDIDSAQQVFGADLYLRLRWFDPKYIAQPSGVPMEPPDWQPRVDLVNARDYSVDLDTNPTLVGPGILQVTRRYRGTFSAGMDLHTFPFDVQDLNIVIEDGVSDASELEWVLESPSARDVQTLRERNELGSLEEVFGMHRDELPEWKVLAIHVERSQQVYSFLGNAPFSRLEIKLTLERQARFYEVKVILVLVVIVVMSWLSFFLKPESLDERGAICLSALLAVIAHNYVVSTILPPISYLTTLDYLVLGGMALVLFAALESLYVYQLVHKAGEANGQRATETARRLDRSCIVASPLVMGLALIACYTR
jgi:hypothetical protein